MSETDQFTGITRFHKITIGAGIAFLAMITWRFVQSWQDHGNTQHGTYACISGALAVVVTVYWIRFWKNGL